MEFKKGNYKKAIKVYTEGLKVNCCDPVVMSTLYANRANAHFKIGKDNWYNDLVCVWTSCERSFSKCSELLAIRPSFSDYE